MAKAQADCVFCDERKIRAEVEFMYAPDGQPIMVFEPLGPVVPGHLLCVPVTHAQDATEDRYLTAMTTAVASRVAQRYPASNLITNVGAAASQTVMHLHVHVVPRRFGDGLLLPWSPASSGGRSGKW